MGKCIVFGDDGYVFGTPGSDSFHFKDDWCEPDRTVYAGAGNDRVQGSSQDDTVYGGSGCDVIYGNCGADTLFGGFDGDKINGGEGNDILVGGYGADWLTGGKGCDTFKFLSDIDSPACQRDIITDFKSGLDLIDLSMIDADSGDDADQAFNFVGQTEAPSIVANSVTWYYDPRACQTHVLADTDGDTGTAEIEIVLAGSATLKHADFVL
jgi:Ca2+-binding RTX toxin-like protein